VGGAATTRLAAGHWLKHCAKRLTEQPATAQHQGDQMAARRACTHDRAAAAADAPDA